MERDIDAEVARRLLDFVERVSDLVGVCDEQGRVLYLNEAARKHLGVGASFDLTTADFFAPEAFKSYYEEVRPTLLRDGTWRGELAIRTQDGGSIPMFFSVVAGVAPGAEITGLVTYGRPLASQTLRATEWRSSTHEAGELVDRSVVEELVGTALARARRNGARVALVCAELRSLGQLVEAHGSFVADGVTRAVGRRLAQTVRASDTVARIGRDTFVVLYENVRDVAEVLRLVQAVQEAFEREPIWTASGEVSVGLTLGLAVGEPEDRPLELIQRAAAAVLESKSVAARAIVLAHEDGSAATAACEALRNAITRGEIRTYAAPVVALPEIVVGHDAFARWEHPTVGALDADALSDLATRAGIGPVIDLRVLREAVALAATSSGQVARRVYAPASEALLADVYVEHHVWEITDAFALSPEHIFLTVDQRVVGERSARIRDTLRSLRDTGCQLVLAGVDDRVDGMDLVGDHEFRELRLADHVARLCGVDADARGRFGRLIHRAHDAGVHVLAAGVSTRSQHEALRDLGCDLATGAFYGDAVAVDSIA